MNAWHRCRNSTTTKPQLTINMVHLCQSTVHKGFQGLMPLLAPSQSTQQSQNSGQM